MYSNILNFMHAYSDEYISDTCTHFNGGAMTQRSNKKTAGLKWFSCVRVCDSPNRVIVLKYSFVHFHSFRIDVRIAFKEWKKHFELENLVPTINKIAVFIETGLVTLHSSLSFSIWVSGYRNGKMSQLNKTSERKRKRKAENLITIDDTTAKTWITIASSSVSHNSLRKFNTNKNVFIVWLHSTYRNSN